MPHCLNLFRRLHRRLVYAFIFPPDCPRLSNAGASVSLFGEAVLNSASVQSLGWTSALFYSSSGVNTVRIPSRIPLSETMQIRRYVALETFLGPGRRVHECRIRVSNRKNVCFIIAVCFDPSYPTNEALRVVLPSSSWRAELFMFRCGTKKPVINLKKGDRHVGERGMIR